MSSEATPTRTRTGDRSRPSWTAVASRVVHETLDDHLAQWAAALGFYALLSVFPAMLALTALLGVLGTPALEPLIQNVGSLAPSAGRDIALEALASIRDSSAAGVSLVLALLVAIWSASAYIGAFIPAANVVWEVEEARPLWKKLIVRVVLTVSLLVLIAAIALMVILTGPIAGQIGDVVGLGDAAVQAWGYAKWPVLAGLAMTLVSLLYWAAPNVRDRRWRWITAGSAFAVVLWVAASLGFSLYVSELASYGELYGSIGSVLVLLLWLWLSNLAILIGAELNAELERGRGKSRQDAPSPA